MKKPTLPTLSARQRAVLAKCPDAPKGTHCELCGGAYVCLQSWRKKRTYAARLQARTEAQADARKRDRR